MTRLTCDGDECSRWVSKDSPRPGWIVVVTYALFENEDAGFRRVLCRKCAEQLERRFQ